MAANLTPIQRIERDTKILSLLRKGFTHREIALELQLSNGNVSRSILRLQSLGRDAVRQHSEVFFTEQLMKARQITDDALAAWKRSQTVKVRQKKKKIPSGGEAHPIEITEDTFENRDGAAVFLMVALRGLEREAKLLGLDAPIVVKAGRPGDPPGLPESDDDKRARIRELLAEAAQLRLPATVIDVTPTEETPQPQDVPA